MPWPDNVTLNVRIGFGSGPLATSPTWTNVTADVRAVTLTRGRSATRRPFDPGTGTIVLDNTAGTYDPNNTASTHAGNLKLGTPISIQAVHSATTYDLFYGFVSRWPLLFDKPSESTVPIEITEAHAIARRTKLTAVTYTEQTTDERIAAILDDVAWPAAWRSLDAGTIDKVAAQTYTGDAGRLIDDTVDAEQGYFWLTGDGTATFTHRIGYENATAAATFGASGHDYSAPTFVYDDDQLVNDAAVTGADDNTQTATDTTSITDHGRSTSQNSTISSDTIHSAPYALNVAEWLVGVNKDIDVRITSFTIYPDKAATLWPQALGRELGDVVNVEYTPPAGDTLDQDVRIESIRHEIRPAHWQTTYGCATLATFETQTYWTLGTDLLGTGTRLA